MNNLQLCTVGLTNNERCLFITCLRSNTGVPKANNWEFT